MIQITISNIIPATPPSGGWKITYREYGSTAPYSTVPGTFSSQPISFSVNLPAGTLVEGYVYAVCDEGIESDPFYWKTACDCPPMFNVTPDGKYCQKFNSYSADVAESNYHLLGVGNANYGAFLSRIYKSPFNSSALGVSPFSSSPEILYNLTANPQWANTTGSLTLGPVNREAVWFDADNDGIKDPLSADVLSTIAFAYVNPGSPKTVYVGIAADNNFKLVRNGEIIADSAVNIGATSPNVYKIFHIIPVTIGSGTTYFNLQHKADGTANDAMAMVIYDNTAAEIASAGSDSDLNILFKSSSLRGASVDVAHCDDDSMDMSEGVGEYTCKEAVQFTCNTTLDPAGDCEAPTGLSILLTSDTSVNLSWTASPDATAYVVEYRLATSSTWTSFAPQAGTTKSITGLIQGEIYVFRVVGQCPSGSTGSITQSQVMPSENQCSSTAKSRTIPSNFTKDETYELGNLGGTVNIPYNVTSITAAEELAIEVWYHGVKVAFVEHKIEGDTGTITFNYSPVGSDNQITLRFIVTDL